MIGGSELVLNENPTFGVGLLGENVCRERADFFFNCLQLKRDPEALGERDVDGERLHGLAVHYPPTVPAHSREQQWWFTADGALRRNDYRADMVSPLAHAANRVHHETTEFGITLPDERRVTPQLPGRRSAPFPLLVSIAFELEGVEPA